MRGYTSRVALLNSSGMVIHHLPRALAEAMVAAGDAEPTPGNGRIRSVRLILTAGMFAQRIGEPSPGAPFGVRFTRWTTLPESGARIVEHHPRTTDYGDR